MSKTTETAFNFQLAAVLRGKHPRWPELIDAERTSVLQESSSLQPDIIVDCPGGLSIAVETEYSPAHTVEEDARKRIGSVLSATGDSIEQAIAVRIPKVLASAPQSELEFEIEAATFEYCVFSDNPQTPERWPKTGWLEGTIDDLASCIELAALSENRVAQSMGILEDGIAQAAGKLRRACGGRPDTLDRIANVLHQKDGLQTSRMAMAILANALSFHIVIAGAHKIETLGQLQGLNRQLSKDKVLGVWCHILDNINYWPIFKIASDILLPIRDGTAQLLLDRLATVAAELDNIGATSQHDLSGRMFQRLITDRKFLATFYTLPSSAALLAELAVARLGIDWSDPDAITSLRIADFACGTGALLNAAYHSILTRYRRTGGDDSKIHSQMMERVLVGSDIMPAAAHLTASVLSSAHPTITFDETSIITLPYGRQTEDKNSGVAIGALDLITDKEATSIFETGQTRLKGKRDSPAGKEDLPPNSFDLVIMNPPFTRATNHEAADAPPVPSFAGFDTSEQEQEFMSSRLKKIRKPGMAGHGNAGLASNFVDLAHAKVKSPGGIIALVLPAAILQGVSWAAARNLLSSYYKDISIVSIAATGSTDRAFSADTGMAEVLVIATRRRDANGQEDEPVQFVNLMQRPQTILEAVTISRSICRVPREGSVHPVLFGRNATGGHIIWSTIGNTGSAAILTASVAKTASALRLGKLQLPRLNQALPLPVTTLATLGDKGLLDRDIVGKEKSRQHGGRRGPFDKQTLDFTMIPTYPMLWSHNAKREKRMIVEADSMGVVRTGCRERANEAWTRTASQLHFNRDFRINSQPLAACLTPQATIGGSAWPNFVCYNKCWETPLVLWANTTLGLIAFWWIGTRQQEGRARLTISKLPSLSVIDPRELTPTQLDTATRIFDEFQDQELLPANEAHRDSVRQALDLAMLIDLLGLPKDVLEPLDLLRRQWCAEPSVHGGKGTAPSN